MTALTITCIFTFVIGILFSRLLNSDKPFVYSDTTNRDKENKISCEIFKFQVQEDKAINAQHFEDMRFERNINREVGYRVAAHKDRMEIEKKYPHFDECQKFMMESYSPIRVLNPMDFTQMIYHSETAKYKDVNHYELINEKVKEKIKQIETL